MNDLKYLHLAYRGLANGELTYGDCLYVLSDGTNIADIREEIKKRLTEQCGVEYELVTIISITELSASTFRILKG